MDKLLTDSLSISKRRRRTSSKSMKNLEQIPVDIIFEIFAKLPWKSTVRFRCASRDWNSFLRSSDFTDLFMKVSSSSPRLLFTVNVENHRYFYSVPQPLYPNNNSSPLTVDYHICFPFTESSHYLNGSVNGWLCTKSVRIDRRLKNSNMTMYNPSTRQSIPISIMKSRGRSDARTVLGYDPINKQYKVLCMSFRNNLVTGHEILTLGTGKPAWRIIESSLPQYYPYFSICINGVVYYLGNHGEETIVICFDVRSEKFKFIESKVKKTSMLVNYKGKLAIHPYVRNFNGKVNRIKLLVLDDVEKNEWSQHIFVFPPLWKDLIAGMKAYFVGVSSYGEFVFSTAYDPLYIFFYNVEKNTIARVRIQGMKTIEGQSIPTFIDYTENAELMCECSGFHKTLKSVTDCLAAKYFLIN